MTRTHVHCKGCGLTGATANVPDKCPFCGGALEQTHANHVYVEDVAAPNTPAIVQVTYSAVPILNKYCSVHQERE